MAPREATGTFPDQFLTFDYDAMGMGGGGGGGGPAPAHDNAANNLPTGPTETEEGDHAQLNPPLPMHHPLSDRPDSLSSTIEAVDPLSIDPTVDEDDEDDGDQEATSGAVDPQHLVLRLLQHSSSPTVESAAGPPTSPLSTGSSFANMISSNRRRTMIPFPSVLDTAESDDEDDDNAVPALETTIISSSSTVSDSNTNNNSNHHTGSMMIMNSPMSTARMWSNHESSTLTAAHMVSAEDVSDILDGNDDDEDEVDDEGDDPSVDSSDSLRMIYRNTAFDGDEPQSPSSVSSTNENVPPSPNSIMLSFGPNTTVADLKYFAERGCIVALLQALTTPRLVTLGSRMLADYAKMSHRRVAVASNRRILEFVQRTMLQVSEDVDWPGREYAVETVRSLTATEESDKYLMGTFGLLNSLALVSRGGPFVSTMGENGCRIAIPLASEKSRLHACIAIMNLSCGKANKIEIARIPDVLEAMRDVMLSTSNEARLKATTCVKNLSNADANDGALLGTDGLLEALGRVAAASCSIESGASSCTTNACLALMNLSISKVNKHRVFRTKGIMESLMTVLERTAGHPASTEARVKACSALSNLAIGYDNKIPMFNFPGFVESILQVIRSDIGEARTKACSILWSFAAEMKNQGPVVARGDILPVLVHVAEEDGTTEARFKCVAALTLLAESLDNAVPLLDSGALTPLMEILHDAGPDPTQWKGQTASWCVGFLMNISQSDEAVPSLRDAGVVELLAPLLTLDHYQSLKAAMAVTFCCRYDEGDECYDLLRKTENVIPKIISLLHNTLSGRGGNGYKYGVFTLRSSVGCIDALASGPDFMKERIATAPVFESLLRVIHDFCVDGGTPGAIVGGGRDDPLSATLAVRALYNLTEHLIPMTGSSALPFGRSFDGRVLTALDAFVVSTHPDIREDTKHMASDAKTRIYAGRDAGGAFVHGCRLVQDSDDVVMRDVTSFASSCCGFPGLPGLGEDFLHALALPSLHRNTHSSGIKTAPSILDQDSHDEEPPVRTFLLADQSTGRRFVVPKDPSGGRSFNDTRVWCYRRGRFCRPGEEADPNYVWTAALQQAYDEALARQQDIDSNSTGEPLVAKSFDGLQ